MYRSIKRGMGLLLVTLLLVACGHAKPRTTLPVPETLSDESYADAFRGFHRLPSSSSDRAKLQAQLSQYVAADYKELIESHRYDDLKARFEQVARFHTPSDINGGKITREYKGLAEYFRTAGPPRGDEGAVLAALRVLRALNPDDSALETDYNRVKRWGLKARGTLPSPLERYSRLIEVWQEHSRLSPAPEVLVELARMFVERRDAMARSLQAPSESGDAPSSLSRRDLFAAPAVIQQAPLEVAAVFLENGDVSSAITHVQAMGDSGGAERRLIMALEDATGGDDQALYELAMTYIRGRPETARGICLYGFRRFSSQPRFPVCLARIATEANAYSDAIAWFAEAIAQEPDNKELYDEALQQLATFVQRAPADVDPRLARGVISEADSIVRERNRRFPDEESRIALDRLYLAVGLMEMNAGEIDEARRRFEASLAYEESAAALQQLGQLAAASDQHERAVELYRKALALTNVNGAVNDVLTYEDLLSRIAISLNALGKETDARKEWESALAVLAAAESQANPFGRVEIDVRRGLIYDRMGRHDDGEKAFRAAMDTARNLRSTMGGGAFPANEALQQTYARILSYLVSAERPNLELATAVFHAAQRQLTLDAEWKVYFALWFQVIAVRKGEPMDPEVRLVLEQHKKSEAWFGRLASFGLGELGYDKLLNQATNIGQETESHFYEVINALRKGDKERSRRLLEKTIGLNMVNFYEFAMAKALLQR